MKPVLCFGEALIDFLHVGETDADGLTLAFVFLDGDGDRSFSFYRDRTADVLFSISNAKSTAGGKCDYNTIGACRDVLRVLK